MEGLARIVTESLARHNFEPVLDHRRLRWSRWFRCEDSFSVLLVPSKPGLFALAEEMIGPGETGATGGKRMLALFEVGEATDLGMKLGRMFLPGNPLRERFASGSCFARYVQIDDPEQRQSALATLQHWMASVGDGPSGNALQSMPFQGGISQASDSSPTTTRAEIHGPTSLPSGF